MYFYVLYKVQLLNGIDNHNNSRKEVTFQTATFYEREGVIK